MTRSPYLAVPLLILSLAVLAYAVGFGRYPLRRDPPRSGTPAEIGVAYGVEAWCPVPILVGDLWWVFPEPIEHWPDIDIPPWPFSIWAEVSEPYPVRGVLILSSPTQAVFRADSDGSEFTMTPHRQNPMEGYGCL